MKIGTNPQVFTGAGSLNYDMIISSGELGGTTEIRITPLHNFDQITPRKDHFIIFSMK